MQCFYCSGCKSAFSTNKLLMSSSFISQHKGYICACNYLLILELHFSLWALISLMCDSYILTQEKFCNNACVERFLKAKGDNVKKAAKHLRACLSWRESIGTGIGPFSFSSFFYSVQKASYQFVCSYSFFTSICFSFCFITIESCFSLFSFEYWALK